MSRTGKLYYREEQFLGVQELTNSQDLKTRFCVELLKKFGERGLFDLSRERCSLTWDLASLTAHFSVNTSEGFLAGYNGVGVIFADFNQSVRYGNGLLPAPTSGNFYVGLRGAGTMFEEGEVTLGSDGTLSGNGTWFKKLFRDAIGKRVSRVLIRQTSGVDLVYAVNRVISNTEMKLLPLGGSTTFPSITTPASFAVIATMSPFILDPLLTPNVYGYDSYQLAIETTPFDETLAFQIAVFPFNQPPGTIPFTQITRLRSFGDKTVETNDIVDKAVTHEKLADDAVHTNNIKDGAVTTNKLATGAVNLEKTNFCAFTVELKWNGPPNYWTAEISRKVDSKNILHLPFGNSLNLVRPSSGKGSGATSGAYANTFFSGLIKIPLKAVFFGTEPLVMASRGDVFAVNAMDIPHYPPDSDTEWEVIDGMFNQGQNNRWIKFDFTAFPHSIGNTTDGGPGIWIMVTIDNTYRDGSNNMVKGYTFSINCLIIPR